MLFRFHPTARGNRNLWAEQKEKNDLLEELMLLPENAVVRRINELVKRARSVKVHAYIIHYLRKQMPYMMGKQDKQVRAGFLPFFFVSTKKETACLE